MICLKCLNEMIQIDLYNVDKKHYHAGYCLECGNFATGIGERKVWEGKRTC